MRTWRDCPRRPHCSDHRKHQHIRNRAAKTERQNQTKWIGKRKEGPYIYQPVFLCFGVESGHAGFTSGVSKVANTTSSYNSTYVHNVWTVYIGEKRRNSIFNVKKQKSQTKLDTVENEDPEPGVRGKTANTKVRCFTFAPKYFLTDGAHFQLTEELLLYSMYTASPSCSRRIFASMYLVGQWFVH